MRYFFVQWGVFPARVHHGAMMWLWLTAARSPVLPHTWKQQNSGTHDVIYPPIIFLHMTRSTWVHGCAPSNRGKPSWIVDVFQGARVQNSAKNLGVRDRTPSSVPRWDCSRFLFVGSQQQQQNVRLERYSWLLWLISQLTCFHQFRRGVRISSEVGNMWNKWVFQICWTLVLLDLGSAAERLPCCPCCS